MLKKILKWVLGVIAAIVLLFIVLAVVLEFTGYEPARDTTPIANSTPAPTLTRATTNSPNVSAPTENTRRTQCERGGGRLEQTEQGLICLPESDPFPTATPVPRIEPAPKPPRDPAEVVLLAQYAVRDFGPSESIVIESEAQSEITYFAPPIQPDNYIVHSGTVKVDASIVGPHVTVSITAGPEGARISNVRVVGRTTNSEQGNPDGIPVALPCFHHNLDTNDPQVVFAVKSAYDAREAAHPEDDHSELCEAVRSEFPGLNDRHESEVLKAATEKKMRERERRFARLNDPDPVIRAWERDLYCGSADWVEDGFALRRALADFSNFPDAPPLDASDSEYAAHDARLAAWQAEIQRAQQDYVNWLRFCE